TPSRSGIAFAYSPALIAFTAAVYWGSSGLAGGLLAPAPPPPPAAPAMPDSPSVSTAARTPWSASRRSNVSMSSPSRSANRGAPAMVPRRGEPDARSHGRAGAPGVADGASAGLCCCLDGDRRSRALSLGIPGGHDGGDGGLARRRAVRHHDDVRPRRREPVDPP